MKTVKIGSTIIGGGNKIAIQSMTNINTSKVEEVVCQINALKDAGADIVRLAVKDSLDANALKQSATFLIFSSLPIFPGLIRTLSTPFSID